MKTWYSLAIVLVMTACGSSKAGQNSEVAAADTKINESKSTSVDLQLSSCLANIANNENVCDVTLDLSHPRLKDIAHAIKEYRAGTTTFFSIEESEFLPAELKGLVLMQASFYGSEANDRYTLSIYAQSSSTPKIKLAPHVRDAIFRDIITKLEKAIGM